MNDLLKIVAVNLSAVPLTEKFLIALSFNRKDA